MSETIAARRFAYPELTCEPWTSPLLAEAARAAAVTAAETQQRLSRDECAEQVYIGADGTPTMRIDSLVEEAILEVASEHGVNVLSEEAGFIDVGSARTLVVDPLDGSANAAARVPLSSFSGVIVEDGVPVEALTTWIETGRSVQGRVDIPAQARTSGRRELRGSALSMLRPKVGVHGDTTPIWTALSDIAGRVRILSSTCIESLLVFEGGIDVFADPGSDTHRIVDLYAAMLMLPQAGGSVCDAYGRSLELSTDLTLRYSGVIGATSDITAEVAEIIASRPSRDALAQPQEALGD